MKNIVQFYSFNQTLFHEYLFFLIVYRYTEPRMKNKRLVLNKTILKMSVGRDLSLKTVVYDKTSPAPSYLCGQ